MVKYILLLFVIALSQTTKAQSHCAVPEIHITAAYDKRGILSDSCDARGNYYVFHYIKIPPDGWFSVKHKNRTVIFFNREALQVLQGKKVVWQANSQRSYTPGRIECKNSIWPQTDTLWVVDGIPYWSNPLPMGILRIDTLKPNDAAAIYGTRAANGAYLITTKKKK